MRSKGDICKLAGCGKTLSANETSMACTSRRRKASRRMLKTFVSKAAADESTGGVASGYVEDAFKARTKLADVFSILLGGQWQGFMHNGGYGRRNKSNGLPGGLRNLYGPLRLLDQLCLIHGILRIERDADPARQK